MIDKKKIKYASKFLSDFLEYDKSACNFDVANIQVGENMLQLVLEKFDSLDDYSKSLIQRYRINLNPIYNYSFKDLEIQETITHIRTKYSNVNIYETDDGDIVRDIYKRIHKPPNTITIPCISEEQIPNYVEEIIIRNNDCFIRIKDKKYTEFNDEQDFDIRFDLHTYCITKPEEDVNKEEK